MENLKKKISCQLFGDLNGNQYLLPLKSQTINARIMNSIATIEIIQQFFNDTSQPLEVTVNVPIEEDYVIGKLMVQIDDKVIEGKILEKQKAQEKYEDAVAQGHTAMMAQEDDQKEEVIKLTIGNLLPGQEATLHLQLLNILKIEGAAYCLRVPLHYFPTYSSSKNQYSYKFFVEIISDSPVTYLSYPNNSKMVQAYSDESLIHIKIEKAQDNVLCLDNDMVIYYRTNVMESTALYFQISDSHPDQVALMMSIVPSFIESTSVSSSLEIFEEEMPDPQDVQYITPGDCMYIFLVDRSGSMSGGKMTTTVEALKLFLKSLPPRSSFEIISFGSDYTVLSQSNTGFEYNDQTMNSAIDTVSKFNANMGGTEIFKPLEFAIKSIQTKLQKRIFMLTDGEVDNREKVIQLAGQCPFDIRIHSIGIGRDCDVRLVSEVARIGKGSCSLVLDNKDLKAIVIQALGRAKDPSYSNCNFIITPKPILSANNMKYELQEKQGFELFRNEIFLMLSIVSKKDFKKLKLQSKSDIHPVSNKGINHEWTQGNFKQLDKGDELFKIAARMKINELSNTVQPNEGVNITGIQELSLKYQVLSKHTSFLAINKNDKKPVGELRQVKLGGENQILMDQSLQFYTNKKMLKSAKPSIFSSFGNGLRGLFKSNQTSNAPMPMLRSGAKKMSRGVPNHQKQDVDLFSSSKEKCDSVELDKSQVKFMKKMVEFNISDCEEEDEESALEEIMSVNLNQISNQNLSDQIEQLIYPIYEEEEKEMASMQQKQMVRCTEMRREIMSPLSLSGMITPPNVNTFESMQIQASGALPKLSQKQLDNSPKMKKSSIKRQSNSYDDLIMDQARRYSYRSNFDFRDQANTLGLGCF
ncbi:UNKNOWN [Stylonychia lemnae]|uniref:Uncharacterized protein n=1 Tax=Stylonychia lemnae TaxID=5949 RepID=A0A077ZV90_STYLE|nr:UNKNOWN [Stylonychia lemnae]|eukprot:CDW72326.1 UNKNOWN [Stylonychia lemnae]